MLKIKAEPAAGDDLRNNSIPAMVELAKATGCMVEFRGNDTVFWAYPDDSVRELQLAFDRLYPASWIVACHIDKPFLRSKLDGPQYAAD